MSVGLTLRHVQHRLRPTGGSPDDTAALLDGAVAEVGAAIAELRELAGGSARPQLDRGLATALARSRGPGAVAGARSTRAVERLPGDVEAAAYFLASEAVTNVVKHAERHRGVAVGAGARTGACGSSVTDDGVGGAGLRPGSGLAGLADRVDALGGRLDIDSAPGAGTRVTAELPCG